MMLRADVRYVDDAGRLTQAGIIALTGEISALERRIAAAEARIAAAAAVANASGGGTIDAEARAQLAAIKAALT